MGLYGRDAVWLNKLKDWGKDDNFISKTTSTTKLGIDGRVEGLDAKMREEQESLLNKQMAPFADLAVAHTAFFILTGEDLFQGQIVRACGGALYFSSFGLDVNDCGGYGNVDVSASRSLPSTN